MLRALVLLCFIISFFPHDGTGQTSASGLKRKGDQLFEQAQYRSALHTYRQAGLETSNDKTLRERIGICMYEINDVDGAIRIFQQLIQEGKTEASVFLQIAKCYQSRNLFPDAIGYYKQFLQKCKKHDPIQAWVKDELVRCANGLRLKHADEQAYVENAGTTINTQFREYGVRTSPTTIDKIYFNSDRDDITHAKPPNGNVDIYAAALINGRWTAPAPLPAHINSPGYDEVCGFSGDGQILYYLTTSGKQFLIRTDTFTGDDGHTFKGSFQGPYKPNRGGNDLIFFNDSICLFASDMPGGFGGYDLYISILRNGSWTRVSNLGSAVNTFYDERYPFLTRDGLTLFYSSNNLESIGGYDVFTTTFDEDSYSWSPPANLGFPVNSSLDDTYLVPSPDGMTAYLTSDRKDGYGEDDLYRVFFKRPILAHQHISAIPTFYHSLLLHGEEAGASASVADLPAEVKEYYISHLFLDENAEILTPQNIKKLDLLANLMTIYPKIKAELSCFELPSGQQTFNLYFSLKKTERASEYLVNKGIARNRFVLKGYGSSFPLVTKPPGNTSSPVYVKLNQRMEFTLHDTENEPVIIHMEKIMVPENLIDPKGEKFSVLRHQFYYSIQIASVTQILQNPRLESVEEMFIEVDNVQGNYLYMAGIVPSYKEADKIRSDMVELGFPDARIIPYVNGIRIPASSLPDMAKQYPDLLFYLAATKK